MDSNMESSGGFEGRILDGFELHGFEVDGSKNDGFEVLQRDGFEPNNDYLSQIESIIS